MSQHIHCQNIHNKPGSDVFQGEGIPQPNKGQAVSPAKWGS